MDDFPFNEYRIRRKSVNLFSLNFRISSGGKLLFLTRTPNFQTWAEIHVYAGPSMDRELFLLRAMKRRGVDFLVDVVDSRENRKVGALRWGRPSQFSHHTDRAEVLDREDQPIAVFDRDLSVAALLHRFLLGLVPLTAQVRQGDRTLAVYKRYFNPFRSNVKLSFPPGGKELLDPRLALAAGIFWSLQGWSPWTND